MAAFTRRWFMAATLGAAAARSAAAAEVAVFPTIVLQLRGGWDPVMTFDARSGYLNRDVTDGAIRETRAGMRWNSQTLMPLAAHLEDAALVRNLKTPGGHETGWANLWYGTFRYGAAPGTYQPWPNHLASALLARARAVAPNVVSYWVGGTSDTDYLKFSNPSPHPQGAAQRVANIAAFVASLDVSRGLPSPAVQERVYRLAGEMDGRHLSPSSQGRILRAFAQAGAQASELLRAQAPSFWPPEPEVRAHFGLTDAELNAVGKKGAPAFKPAVAFAFCLARARLSHVITVCNEDNSFDSHRQNITDQKAKAASHFPVVARLLDLLKRTPSPVLPGVSMFDTTHVVMLTEMGRAPVTDKDASGDATGTAHWPWGNAVFFGGRFKRGVSFGSVGADLVGLPADFTSGEPGKGATVSMANLAATIMRANGVDPKSWTEARAVDALLRG